MIQAASDVLRANGLHLMIADSGHRLEDEEAMVSAFWRSASAASSCTTRSTASGCASSSGRSGVPVIETGNLPDQPLDMAVSYWNFEAARTMTLHLARLGYRKIGFVTLGARQRPFGGAPAAAFAALEELGRPADESLVLEAAGGFGEGADALVRLVKAHPDLDAGFFAGEVLAVGALVRMPAPRLGRARTHRRSPASLTSIC